MSRLIYDLPAAEYHALERLSSTWLGHLATSPAHLAAYRASPPEQTPDMKLGEAIHMMVLEPTRAREAIAVAPTADRRTKKGKAAHAAFEEGKRGCLILTEQEYATAIEVTAAVLAHPVVAELLSEGRPEVTALWESDGVPCRARVDWLGPAGVHADLKTVQPGMASPSAFPRVVAQRAYHRQAAWYLDGLEACGVRASHMLLIAAEKAPPWAVAVYALSPEALERGRELYRRGLALYRQCAESGEWPAYPRDIINLYLPAWSMRDEQPIDAY